jgi:hypothetical protein
MKSISQNFHPQTQITFVVRTAFAFAQKLFDVLKLTPFPKFHLICALPQHLCCLDNYQQKVQQQNVRI